MKVFWAIARRELVNLQTIIQQAADPNSIMAINVQRGIRIIVTDTIFATPFSDLFRTKFYSEILLLDLKFNITF
jgi:hypothetical protein